MGLEEFENLCCFRADLGITSLGCITAAAVAFAVGMIFLVYVCVVSTILLLYFAVDVLTTNSYPSRLFFFSAYFISSPCLT